MLLPCTVVNFVDEPNRNTMRNPNGTLVKLGDERFSMAHPEFPVKVKLWLTVVNNSLILECVTEAY